jgi:hypothetical protein
MNGKPLPLTKGPVGPQRIPTDGTSLNDLNFCKTLLAIMVGWNDGEPVVFSQADFDAIAGTHLLEGFTADGQFVIGLQHKVILDA